MHGRWYRKEYLHTTRTSRQGYSSTSTVHDTLLRFVQLQHTFSSRRYINKYVYIGVKLRTKWQQQRRMSESTRLARSLEVEPLEGCSLRLTKIAQKFAAKQYNQSERTKEYFHVLEKIRRAEPNNIVKIFGIEVKEGPKGKEMWAFMEYCASDLNEAILDGTISGQLRKLEVMLDIATGVEALHAQGFIHTDIYPSNILLSDRGVAKIGDLDLVKILAPGKTSVLSDKLGTHAFLGPEFFEISADGKFQFRKTMDIYTTGATFLTMLQGKDNYMVRSGSRCLIPKAEIFVNREIEFEQEIGRVQFNRSTHETQEVIEVSGNGLETAVRVLTRKMMHVTPDSRPTAPEIVERLTGLLVSFPLCSACASSHMGVKAPSHQASASTDGYFPQHLRRHAMPMLSVHKPITFTHGRHWQQYAGPTLR